jgi:cytochrome c2
MNRKITFTISCFLAALFLLVACVNKTSTQKDPVNIQDLTKNQTEVHGNLIKAEDVHLTNPLNAQWIADGKSIYDLKCQACHKLTDEKLVGPGWKGVTQRRKPEWILNFVTNVETMLETDSQAQKLLEECLVRMPNQNLTIEEARKVLEFQRSNDGEK